VQYAPGTSDATADDIEHGAGAAHVGDVYGLDVRVVQVPASRAATALSALQHNPHVAYAEVDAALQVDETLPDDPNWSKQWGLTKVHSPAAWDITTGSAAVVVAVLDTGVNPVADLGAMTAGWDFVNSDADPADDNGHGTRMAGVAAARGNNALGVAGTCWQCAVMPIKVMRADGTGSMSTVASGITWAVDHGARVISMSVSSSSSTTTLLNAVRYAHDKGAVLFGSAGNDGGTTARYPAAYAEVIGVAGTDSNDARYSWSNYGSWVKVAAPGCSYSTNPDGTFGSTCGTSPATPVAAGIAALALSARPDATAAMIESAIETSAVPVGDIVQFGRVDALATLTALGAAPAPEPTPGPTPEPTPEPAPEPAPAPAPTTVTETFTGSLGAKAASRSQAVTVGAGELSLALTFTKASSLKLSIVAANGAVVATTSGASVLHLTTTVAADTYTLVVTGTRASYSLAAMHVVA
jgi:hypothetical protein